MNPTLTPEKTNQGMKRITTALQSVAGATADARDAVDKFLQAVELLQKVADNAQRMPSSESPLLLSQFVLLDTRKALQTLKEGLAILPSQQELQDAPEANQVIYTDEEVEDQLIGPLSDKDTLREGDLIFLLRNRAGNRLFRKLTGGMVGKRMEETPFSFVYRTP